MSNNPINSAAAEWFARLDKQSNPALEEQCKLWRAADPRHEVAYLRLKATSQRLERLQALRPPAGQAIDPDLLAASHNLDLVVSGSGEPDTSVPKVVKWTRSAGRWSALAAGVAGLIVATVYLLQERVQEDRYHTGIGGFERVVLADGSVIELNTNTEIRVSFSTKRREVSLVTGEASFNVTHDAGRPFVVVAGDAAVRSLGTQFNVRQQGEVVDVIVTEGRVAVGQIDVATISAPAFSGSSRAPVVGAGQAARVTRGSAYVRRESPQDAARELAWQDGMLMFNSAPLSEVVAEFNRYNRRQLVIADPAIAGREIGGYFKSRNLDIFVKILHSSFGVDAEVAGDRIVLRQGGAGS